MSRLKKRLWPPATIQTTGAGRLPLVGRDKAMLTKNEGLIYQEIALVRFLLGYEFKLLFSGNEAMAAT